MPQPKKQSRPRLDAVIRHIKSGSYDDDMSQLRGAIEDRQRQRQEAVMGLVREVFGENAYVDDPKYHPKTAPPSPRPRPGGPIERHENEVLPGESPHVQVVDPLGDDPMDDPDTESRSPVIGSIDDTIAAPPDPEPEAAE